MNDGVNADMAKIDVIMNEEAGWRERKIRQMHGRISMAAPEAL